MLSLCSCRGLSLDPVGQFFHGLPPCQPGQDSVPLRHPRCLTTTLSILRLYTPPKTSAYLTRALLPTALPQLLLGAGSSLCGPGCIQTVRLPRVMPSAFLDGSFLYPPSPLGCCESSASDHMAWFSRCQDAVFSKSSRGGHESVRAFKPQLGV